MNRSKVQKDLEEKIRALEAQLKDLDDTKNYYKAFFDHGLYGSVILDPAASRLIEFNDQACRQLGYTRDEFARLSLSDIEVVETAEETSMHIQKVIQTGFDEFETLHRTKHGEMINVQVLAQAINVGNRQAYHCIWRDITSRKIAEETVRNSEKHFRLLTENATDTIWMLTLDGQFIYHSPSVERLRGYTPSEANQIALEQTLTPGSLAIVQSIFREEGDKPMEKRWADRTIELEMYKKDGAAIWTEVSLRAVRDKRGIVIGLQGSTRNIEERKKSERSLRESGEKFRSITENAVDCIFIKDKDRKYTFVNKAMKTLFNLSDHEIIGKKPEALFTPDQAGIVKKIDDRTFKGESVNETESLVIRGKTHFFNTIQTPLSRENGEVTSIMGIVRDVTEQKTAEISLLRSEQKWRSILVNTPQIGISLDPNGKIIFSNNHFLQLTGWRQEEVLGSDWFDMFIPAPIREEIRGVFRTTMTQNDTSGFLAYENEIVTKGGERRNIAWSNVLTKGPRGEIVDVTCLGIDLTERQRAEIILKESEEKYRLLVENQSDMVVKVDTQGRFLFVSPSYCRTFGKTEAELLGQQFMPLVHDDDRASTAEAMEALYVPPHAAYMEQRAMTKDGWRWLAWADTAVLDEEGNVKEVIGVGRDITRRKNVEDAVRRSESKFRNLYDLSPQAIALTDLKTEKLIDVNHKFCELTRYGRDEVIGRDTADIGFLSNKDRKRYRGMLQKAGQINGLEMVFKAKDGSKLTTLIFAQTIDVSGESLILTIFHDITAQKRLEASLKRAQKMESIGNLSGGIAHDVNNILFPIVGMSEMLMDDFPPESFHYKSASEIFKAAMRGRDLVKQILAFSRQAPHQLIPIQPQQILKEAIKLCRSTIPRDIDIHSSIQEDCGLVMADPSQLHQVVMNLITNAYHALEQSGGNLSVAMQEIALNGEDIQSAELEPGKYVEITVSDTGCGIDPPLMEKIFEPYFTTKEKGKGTGLGLSVVYGIVKEHRGDIKVYSEIGQGTTVKVFLPLMESPPETAPYQNRKTVDTGTERILLVDDEVTIAELEKQMLERLGYRVTVCFSSLETLETFKANSSDFDLVVSDMTMPKMTGERLARELIAIRSDIPIIICTGFSERLNEENASAIGIKGFLMKPIVIAEMAQMVRKVLDEAKTRG